MGLIKTNIQSCNFPKAPLVLAVSLSSLHSCSFIIWQDMWWGFFKATGLKKSNWFKTGLTKYLLGESLFLRVTRGLTARCQHSALII